MTDDAAVRLFAYGTLRQANVQMASFGPPAAPMPCHAMPA